MADRVPARAEPDRGRQTTDATTDYDGVRLGPNGRGRGCCLYGAGVHGTLIEMSIKVDNKFEFIL